MIRMCGRWENKEGKKRIIVAIRSWPNSNLAFDVDLFEGRVLRRLEDIQGLSSQKSNTVVTLLKEVLTAVLTDESGRFIIGLEAELLRDESQFDIRLVPAPWLVAIILLHQTTHDLQIFERAARRSRLTNMSIRYAPIFGVSKYSWKNL